jgi:short subunit dehydrogenase-like uncharacterized protein
MGGDREFDVVVFGATGFVGRLVATPILLVSCCSCERALTGMTRLPL